MSEDQAIAIEFTDNFDPATGEVFARLPEAASSDVDSAVEVAAAVKSIWASLG